MSSLFPELDETIFIKNLRNEKPKEKTDFKVDRSTPLGNPFPMKFESERDSVCDDYSNYWLKLIEVPEKAEFFNKLLEAYKTNGEISLFCWCAPRRCHAETIKSHLLQAAKNSNQAISLAEGVN